MSDTAPLPTTEQLEISVHDGSLHLNASTLWVDCREQDEHRICHIEGAKLLPLSNFASTVDQILPEDKSQAIIVHCHHGMRSLQAVQFLRQKGYPNTWSLNGGIDLWSQEIDNNVPRY
ncbi:MAG: rhodanese [Verrucomicrobiales bacterium]|nr:rhodanese [Verrucomicrobiales bacterium]